MTWQFVLTGLLIGALVGATGMGGGSLMTPILVLVFGFQPFLAVGTDLFHGAIFKTVGALRHRQLGSVHGQLSGWMLLGSAPMSLVGVAAATWLKRTYGESAQTIETYALGAALLAGGIGLFVKSFMRGPVVPDGLFVMSRRDRIAAVAIGVVGGFVVGLTSVGSGVFFAITLLVVFPLRARKVVGTDILHAAALLWVAGMGHLVAGNVDLHAVAWLLVGSVPGVLLGSELPARVHDAQLRLVLSGVLVISSVKLLMPAGPTGTTVAVLAGGLATFAALRLNTSRTRIQAAFSAQTRAEDAHKRAAGKSPSMTGDERAVEDENALTGEPSLDALLLDAASQASKKASRP